MKRSAIYKRAALLINSGFSRYACTAVSKAEGSHPDVLYDFEFYFKPELVSVMHPWFGNNRNARNQELRMTALLLMAEIARSEYE